MGSGLEASVTSSVQRLFSKGEGTVAGLSDAQLLERFITRGDGAAFQMIVERHGALVLGVCRRVLANTHDVEDAFQATFLVLVKNGRSIQDRNVLATWLHGVARRIALRAKVNSLRRRSRELSRAEDTRVDSQNADAIDANELRTQIDDELDRLPSRYRTPVVLCDLEGQSHEDAAAQLGCPVGTVKSRLSRGRARLRSRLVRRGIAPSAAIFASTTGTDAAVPINLVNQTKSLAVAFAKMGSGVLPAEVASLMKGVSKTMVFVKLRVATMALLGVSLAGAGTLAMIHTAKGRLARGSVVALEGSSHTASADPAQSVTKPSGSGSANQPAKEAGVERFQLENGLQVILRPIQGASEIALVTLFSVGSDHDPQGRCGMGHLIEHVYVTAAAGQAKMRTADEFARRYPSGANAQTGDRYTVVATTFAAKDAEKELEDAAARMADLRITAADLDRERPRLREELENMRGGILALGALNNARDLVRPAPGAGRRGGEAEQFRDITADDLIARCQRYYKPRNAILSVAGDFEPTRVRKLIETHFAKVPAGDAVPTAREPGKPKFGFMRELTVPSALPGEKPHACLVYLAPQPGDALYAPFLVLVSRLWTNAEKLGGGAFPPPVYFTPLDDGAIVGITAEVKPGETPAKVFARIEEFVKDAVEPKLQSGEASAVRDQLGGLLGTATFPDAVLAQNPYGIAFSLGRRTHFKLDAKKLGQALTAVTDQDMDGVRKAVFDPSRQAGVFMSIMK
jgi:zinc protease